jgi:hypothetical protein
VRVLWIDMSEKCWQVADLDDLLPCNISRKNQHYSWQDNGRKLQLGSPRSVSEHPWIMLLAACWRWNSAQSSLACEQGEEPGLLANFAWFPFGCTKILETFSWSLWFRLSLAWAIENVDAHLVLFWVVIRRSTRRSTRAEV